MGSSQVNNNILDQYQIKKQHKGYKTLIKKGTNNQQFALKSYRTYSIDEHEKRITYFKQYREKMSKVIQTSKLIDVIEQKKEKFCANDYKVSLIYQYSNLNIESEIQQRMSEYLSQSQKEKFYFSYDDLCNILYTCLSALWIVKKESQMAISQELRNYKTIFLTTKDILIMEDGTIKVIDPYLKNFDDRYVQQPNINYSPEKLINFSRIDDQKCAIFELGILMLSISLLELDTNFNGPNMFNLIQESLEQVKNVYSSAIEQIGINLFDIIKNMVQIRRQQRFSLQQAINYAEQMYEQKYNSPSKANLIDKLCNSDEKEQKLKRTNHASTNKRSSPSLKKFYQFKQQFIEQQSKVQKYQVKSPQISNFTIQQDDLENQEQSGMIQSLQIQQPTKNPNFTSSIWTVGVFYNLKANDNYAYETEQNSQTIPENDERHIFTDPSLLASIKRQLVYINERKKFKLQRSRVLERKDRYLTQETIIDKINNSVYLKQ